MVTGAEALMKMIVESVITILQMTIPVMAAWTPLLVTMIRELPLKMVPVITISTNGL